MPPTSGAIVRAGSALYRRARPRRFVLVSQAYGFVYFQVPKVATRSLLAALTSIDPEAVEMNKVPWSPRQFRGLRSFAFVRDPWDRLVSCWANKVRDTDQFARYYPALRDADLETFIDTVATWDLRTCDAHVRLQSQLIPRAVDFIGRFETLENDFAALSAELGMPAVTLQQRNSSRPSATRPEITPELRERVAVLYADDIKRFGYG